jgi:menaquinone-dependent protoporphyrinogen oxidase
MHTKVGILYATVDGQTLKIVEQLKAELEKRNHSVEFYSIENFNKKISDFDTFVIGSSIRYGTHDSKILAFIKEHKQELDKIKNAFFSVNLVARKPEKATPQTNPYFIKFLKNIDWTPLLSAVFAGNLDYQKYSFGDRLMIQLIMWMTKGPTNPKTKIEYTDWQKVDEFAVAISLL